MGCRNTIVTGTSAAGVCCASEISDGAACLCQPAVVGRTASGSSAPAAGLQSESRNAGSENSCWQRTRVVLQAFMQARPFGPRSDADTHVLDVRQRFAFRPAIAHWTRNVEAEHQGAARDT
jgi:hypothetical protein